MKNILLSTISTMITMVSVSQFSLGDSLVANYPFDGDATDATGNGYDGTLYGATLTQDRFGNPDAAYEFDGMNDYINTFSTFDFEYRTMSLWVKPYDITGDGLTEKHIAGQDANTLAYGQLKAKFSNGNLEVRAGGEASNYVWSVNSNTWYHIVLVRDGSQCTYYLNNVPLGTASSGAVASWGTPNPDFIIGAGRELTNQFFEGVIDDVRIYNRALGADEVDSLFNLPNTVGLVEEDKALSRIDVFPNPVSEVLFWECDIDVQNVELIDAQGKVVYSERSYSPVRVADFENGVYILTLTSSAGEVRRRRVVVSHE